MSGSAVLFVVVVAILGSGLVGGLLYVRARDQRARDARRTTVQLRLGRGLTAAQVEAVLRAIVGIGEARSGLVGQDAVAAEIVATRTEVTPRLRLPATSATYLIGQLRAVLPGVAIEEVETPLAVSAAMELRRPPTAVSPMPTGDLARVSTTVLAAMTGLRGSEVAVWQVVILGGTTRRPLPVSRTTSNRPQPKAEGEEVVRTVLRLGAAASSPKRAAELVARMRRAATSATTPGARLLPRLLPAPVVADRIRRAATPITPAPDLLSVPELVGLLGWPIDGPLIAGLTLGGSPQLPASPLVPRTGRVLGRALVPDRPVAQPVTAASEHMLITGPTGSGKSVLSVRLALDDIAAGRGTTVIDPKGSTVRAILQRMPEEAIDRVVLVDPTDEERPVPLPLLSAEAGGIPELAADNLVGLLRHRYRDLGPRSTDILSASLYALSRVPGSTLMDLLRLWSEPLYRASVAARVAGDPVLSGFFAWFEGLGVAERNFILAAPMNKVRPLLQRPVVRNVIAAPRATFTMNQALREGLIVLVSLPEGVLGSEATSLMGQVLLSRLWAATQARRGRKTYLVTVDEAPRFIDMNVDLGDVLARSREYGVGYTLLTQSVMQLPQGLREIALNSARTKVAFGTSATDARRLAPEFGPGVSADHLSELSAFHAIGTVSLGGSASAPFTFKSEPLEAPETGRIGRVREVSRKRWGIPRAEIEAALLPKRDDDRGTTGPVGRRKK